MAILVKGGLTACASAAAEARAFRSTFPDARFTIVDAIAESDKVVLHLRFLATHSAGGRLISMTGMVLYRLVAGKIVESWSNWDELGPLKQLGGQVVRDSSPA